MDKETELYILFVERYVDHPELCGVFSSKEKALSFVPKGYPYRSFVTTVNLNKTLKDVKRLF